VGGEQDVGPKTGKRGKRDRLLVAVSTSNLFMKGEEERLKTVNLQNRDPASKGVRNKPGAHLNNKAIEHEVVIWVAQVRDRRGGF